MPAEAMIVLLLAACSGDKLPEDTAPATDDTGDTPDDSAPDTDDTTDTDTGETDTHDTDTAIPDPCPSSTVTFTGDDGSVTDVTDAFLTGTYLTLDMPGRLDVCPGTWFSRVLIRADVAVVGLGATPADTVLSGGESGTILDVQGPDVTLDVSNVTLDRGVGLDEAHNSGGGGVYCEGYGAVNATDVVFSHNTANDGPGMYVQDCEVTLTDSSFVDNVAEDDGGALTIWYSHGGLDNVTFSDNEGLDGGAMAVFYGTATITNSTFSGNYSGHFAGALWMYYSDLEIADTVFSGNTNAGGDGGGLLMHGTATIDRVTFSDNTAVRGGGLFVYYQANVVGTDCDFATNTPEDMFVADYSDAGGVSVTAGAGYSFACAANVCTGE